MNKQPAVSTNRSMPSAIVIPELAYPDVRQAVEWLCRSFGFVERLRIGNHRAQLAFGQGSLIVTKQTTHPDSYMPTKGFNDAVMVRVTDIDAHYTRAKDAGVQIISHPTDQPYGERQYVADDLGGHRWTFSQTMADIDPSTWGGTLLV